MSAAASHIPSLAASLLGPGRLVACFLVSQLLRGGSTSRKPLRLGKVQQLLSPQSGWGTPGGPASSWGLSVCPPLSPPVFDERPVHGHSVERKLSADAGRAEAAGQPPGRNLWAPRQATRPSAVVLAGHWSSEAASRGPSSTCLGLSPGGAQSRPEACLSRQTCRSRLHRAASASRPEHRHFRLTGVFFTPLLSAECFLCWERVPHGCSVPTSGGPQQMHLDPQMQV